MTEPRETSWEDLRRAAADRESGAAEIARRAAVTLSALPRSDLEEAVRALVRGHPPMAPLWLLGSDVLHADDHAEAARAFAARLVQERDGVAAHAREVLSGEIVVHSYSGTLVAAVAAAGTPTLCARSDPGGEGAETARLLAERGIGARLVGDREAHRTASTGRTVVVGADAVGPGGVLNKVGTRGLAEAARAGGGACYAVAGRSKFVAADLPAPFPFERTTLDVFTAVITDRGPLTPDDAGREAARHRLHPALIDLLTP